MFEASNLQCASLQTKLGFVSMVDRGAMLPNEWRATMNMGPIEGGDKPIRRLDTQVVDLLEQLMDKMDDKNYKDIANLMIALLEEGDKNEI